MVEVDDRNSKNSSWQCVSGLSKGAQCHRGGNSNMLSRKRMNPDLAFIEELSLSRSVDGGSVTRPWCSAQRKKMGPIHSWMKHQWLSGVFQHTGCPTMVLTCHSVTRVQHVWFLIFGFGCSVPTITFHLHSHETKYAQRHPELQLSPRLQKGARWHPAKQQPSR